MVVAMPCARHAHILCYISWLLPQHSHSRHLFGRHTPNREAQHIPRRISHQHSTILLLKRNLCRLQTSYYALLLLLIRDRNRKEAHTHHIRRWSWRVTAMPYIHANMMMIATSRDEQRTRHTRDHIKT